ncbi:hypothetical protein PanWU01x14_203560, partial [Parasponia andersonii]
DFIVEEDGPLSILAFEEEERGRVGQGGKGRRKLCHLSSKILMSGCKAVTKSENDEKREGPTQASNMSTVLSPNTSEDKLLTTILRGSAH